MRNYEITMPFYDKEFNSYKYRVEAETFIILDGICHFKTKGVTLHTAPADKVIVMSEKR